MLAVKVLFIGLGLIIMLAVTFAIVVGSIGVAIEIMDEELGPRLAQRKHRKRMKKEEED